MLIFNNRFVREKWFCSKQTLIDALLITKFKQFQQKPKRFFIIKDFYTKIIDLTQPIDTIFSNFTKHTRTKIKKATSKGVSFSSENSIEEFISFYNQFANSKNLNCIGNLKKYGTNLIITSVSLEGKILCMHSYIMDKNISRARILHSASQFRDITDNSERNFIGLANRFLHFEDMKYFQGLGFKTYDLGGYAHQTKDTSLEQVNNFKDSFNGTLIYEPELQSLLFHLVEKIYLKKSKKRGINEATIPNKNG